MLPIFKHHIKLSIKDALAIYIFCYKKSKTYFVKESDLCNFADYLEQYVQDYLNRPGLDPNIYPDKNFKIKDKNKPWLLQNNEKVNKLFNFRGDVIELRDSSFNGIVKFDDLMSDIDSSILPDLMKHSEEMPAEFKAYQEDASVYVVDNTL